MSSRQIFFVLLAVFVLGAAMRSIPLQFEGFPDPDSYFHARMAQSVLDQQSIPIWDSLSDQGRVYSYPPILHVLMAVVAMATQLPIQLAYKLIGIIVGALFAFSLYFLARRISNSELVGIASAFFGVTASIGVLRSMGFLRPDGLAMVLIPFILWLWWERKSVQAALLSVALVLVHPLSALVFAALLGIWIVVSLFRKQSFSPLIPVAMLGMLGMFFAWLQVMGLSLSNYASDVSLSASELARFSVVDLFLFFPLAWAFAGIGIYDRKRVPEIVMIWFFSTLVIGMLGNRLMVFAIPFYAVMAGFGFRWVIEKVHVDSRAIAAFGVMVVILGALVAYLLVAGASTGFSPASVKGAQWLRANANENESVFSFWDLGHALAYYTQMPQVMDGYFEFGNKLKEREQAMYAIHYSSDCKTFHENMNSFSAKYLFLQSGSDSLALKYGIAQLKQCPRVRFPYANDEVRILERI